MLLRRHTPKPEGNDSGDVTCSVAARTARSLAYSFLDVRHVREPGELRDVLGE